MFVAKYNSSGSCLSANSAGYSGGEAITADANGYCYVTGGFIDTTSFGSTVLINNNGGYIYVAKSDMMTGLEERSKSTNNQLIIYANPTIGKCNITVPNEFLNKNNLTLSVYNIVGKLILQKKPSANGNQINLNLEEQAKGMYNVILSNGAKNYYGKVILE